MHTGMSHGYNKKNSDSNEKTHCQRQEKSSGE
jgi:hypothetical protein